MRKQFFLTVILLIIGVTVLAAASEASAQKMPGNMVFVKGGSFKNTRSSYYGKNVIVSDFYIGKYDVTQKEWVDVMNNTPSKFKGENLPVETVNWYDAIEYCNKRSILEGLKPYYNIDKNKKDSDNKPDPEFGDLDTLKWTVTINTNANGYRLPTEAEWAYAASGGQFSKNYTYSGSDDIEEVAWYWRNSGDTPLSGPWQWPVLVQNHNQTKPVGSKKPNELGLYDMSGNVRQWCWDWDGELPKNVTDPKGKSSGFRRIWRGGGWMGAPYCTETNFRSSLAANGAGPDQGFRVCRNK